MGRLTGDSNIKQASLTGRPMISRKPHFGPDLVC